MNSFSPHALLEMPLHEAVEALVVRAAELRASDLYVLSEEQSTSIAVRRLGIVEPVATAPKDWGRKLIASFKALANMELAEQRRPGDGRWLFEKEDLRLDLRLNCIATLHGQDLACRLLDREHNLLPLDRLGMTHRQLGYLLAMLNSPSGLIFVTGPTGSGKTTTLYGCLRHLHDGTRKINTLEDPIEYSLRGIRQSQVQPKINIHFAELLRNVLRQSPDVIMIGEIRDAETAATAVRAANSGHLVLATLHAPVAASAVQSMLALGVAPYFLAHCLLGVVAQRLIRVLCDACRQPFDISDSPATFEEIQPLLEDGEGTAIYGPGTCDLCFGSGYQHRTGIFEVLPFTGETRRMVAQGCTSKELEQEAVAAGMLDFRRSALLKVARGVTSTEEMLRSIPATYLGLDD